MTSFDKSKFPEIQKNEFESLSEQRKKLVKKGHLIKIISLEKEEEICSFKKLLTKFREDHSKASQEHFC